MVSTCRISRVFSLSVAHVSAPPRLTGRGAVAVHSMFVRTLRVPVRCAGGGSRGRARVRAPHPRGERESTQYQLAIEQRGRTCHGAPRTTCALLGEKSFSRHEACFRRTDASGV